MSPKSNDSRLPFVMLARPLVLIAGMVVMGWSEVELRTPRDEQLPGTTAEEWVRLYNAVSAKPVTNIWGLTGAERQQALQILAEAEHRRSARVIRRLYALVLLQGAGACLSLAAVARFLLRRPASWQEQRRGGIAARIVTHCGENVEATRVA